MKTYVLLVLSFISFSLASAQSCCQLSSSREFAMLSDNKSFVSSHLSPLPFHFVAERGSFITFKAPDGKEGRAFEVKGKGNRFILMFHEWWGLNDYIQREAEKLQQQLGDVTVLAVDLYDGHVASSPEEAGKLMQSVDEKRARSIIQGALEYAGPLAHIGTIGWCFGGGWSLQAAIMAGKQGDACVMYYGMPETDTEKIKSLKAPVLGLFAQKDNWITPEKVNTFEKQMKENGKEISIKFYDADHAFANPSNPKFNKEAGEDAYQKSVAFLKSKLLK